METKPFSPYVRFAYSHRCPAPLEIAERVIYDFELIYVNKGTVNGFVDDMPLCAKRGDIIFLRPKQPHRLIFEGEYVHNPYIHFDFHEDSLSPEIPVSFALPDADFSRTEHYFRDDSFLTGTYALSSKISPKNAQGFYSLFLDIIQTFELRMPYYELHLKSKMFSLLSKLFEEQYWTRNAPYRSGIDTAVAARIYIVNHLTQELTLDEIADELSVNKFYLVKLFKKLFGVTPIRFHAEMRINMSRRLLQTSGYNSISQVSDAMGFGSVQAFSRAFKQIDGVPPSKYLK